MIDLVRGPGAEIRINGVLVWPLEQASAAEQGLQEGVKNWMIECFGLQIAQDTKERNHRFLEESLELVQACGCTADEARQLVDYVFNRAVGERFQEVGGVLVTLAALCGAQNINMEDAGKTELARVWTKIEQIRAKQAAKPKHSPLPTPAQPPAGDVVERWKETYALALYWSNGDIIRKLIEQLTAALAVAREGYVSLADVLGPVNDDDREAWMRTPLTSSPALTMRSQKDADIILANRRDRLAKPAERVKVTCEANSSEDEFHFIVWLDGKSVINFAHSEHAERYANGLRQELKAGKR